MKIRTTLATLLSATALAGVLGAGSAHAAPTAADGPSRPAATPSGPSTLSTYGYANISIRSAGSGNWTITVTGRTYLTLNSRSSVGVWLWGDDTAVDDFISESWGHRFAPDGSFSFSFTTSSALLNEDWGQDEVYGVVGIHTAPGNVRIKTNTVTGYF